MKRLLSLILLIFSIASGWAQEKETPATGSNLATAAEKPPAPIAVPDKQQVALEALALEITEIKSEIQALDAERAKSANLDDRAAIAAKIAEKVVRLDQVRVEFISVASKVDLASVDEALDEPMTLSGEVSALLSPLIDELKKATSGPRDMDALVKKIELAEERQQTATDIVARLRESIATYQGEPLATVLKNRLEDWQEKAEETTLTLDVLNLQKADLEARSVPVVDSLSNMVQDFFRNRGLHLFIALFVFILVLYLNRRGYRFFQRYSPLHRGKGRNLSTRIVDLIFITFGFVFALLGAVLVLYLFNDWLLLTLVLLFVAGTIWVSKQALPKVTEQMKLMLNLGAVREGERVIYEGLPWEVKRINVYTDLVNPALKGGVRRLPIKDLLELRSRVSDSEEWFPCSTGEWVVLSDDTFGRVIEQTPEYVEIIRLGGARKFFPTPDFLELTPLNLSRNFRINSVFGIDYEHQAISTTKVAPIFENRLMKDLVELMGIDAIKNVSVQFKSAGASSLDYEVLADFTGDAAPSYSKLQRIIQRICVDVCNEEGWGIPFTQITVHQAADESNLSPS